jgi:PadR family transcriptional regulator, regulatory protein AphA
MSLKHAILGFLSYSPMTGYDLKKVFDSTVQHFWPADQSQIYRTLATLADEGLAEMEVIPQEGKPGRKVYHVTDAGRAELRQWLTATPPPSDNRSAFLVQVFFASALNDQEALAILQRKAAELQALLALYRHLPEQATTYLESGASDREQFYWALPLEYGIASAQAALAWIESAVQRIQAGDCRPNVPPLSS